MAFYRAGHLAEETSESSDAQRLCKVAAVLSQPAWRLSTALIQGVQNESDDCL